MSDTSSTSLMLYGTQLPQFFRITKRNASFSIEQNQNDSLEFKKRLFAFMDEELQRFKPSFSNDDDDEFNSISVDVESDVTSGQWEKFAELQQMYADMKNIICQQWIANQLVLHEYDPETEYDIHMRSVLMLWKFFILEHSSSSALQSVDCLTNNGFLFERLLDVFGARLSRKDAELLAFLAYGRAMLKKNVHTSENIYYSFLYSHECKSLHHALSKIKREYDRVMLIDQENEVSSFVKTCDEHLTFEYKDSEPFAQLEAEEDALASVELCHKRKRARFEEEENFCYNFVDNNEEEFSDNNYKKRKIEVPRFPKLSSDLEQFLDQFLNCLERLTEKNMDLFICRYY
jgi:hypothetical protein